MPAVGRRRSRNDRQIPGSRHVPPAHRHREIRLHRRGASPGGHGPDGGAGRPSAVPSGPDRAGGAPSGRGAGAGSRPRPDRPAARSRSSGTGESEAIGRPSWTRWGSGEAMRGRSRPRPSDRRDVDYRPSGSHGCTNSRRTSAPPGSPSPCPTASPRHRRGSPSGRPWMMPRGNTVVRVVVVTRIDSCGRSGRTLNGKYAPRPGWRELAWTGPESGWTTPARRWSWMLCLPPPHSGLGRRSTMKPWRPPEQAGSVHPRILPPKECITLRPPSSSRFNLHRRLTSRITRCGSAASSVTSRSRGRSKIGRLAFSRHQATGSSTVQDSPVRLCRNQNDLGFLPARRPATGTATRLRQERSGGMGVGLGRTWGSPCGSSGLCECGKMTW